MQPVAAMEKLVRSEDGGSPESGSNGMESGWRGDNIHGAHLSFPHGVDHENVPAIS